MQSLGHMRSESVAREEELRGMKDSFGKIQSVSYLDD